jgi:DNA polymerase III subunit epsilon
MVTMYDLETTGFPQGPALNHPAQPHIVQMCALVCDHTGMIQQCHNVLVRPDGWRSDPDAFAVHGITHERAMDEGIPEGDAVELLLSCTDFTTRRIAHHIEFDHRMIEIAIARYLSPEHLEGWREGPESYCTLKKSRELLRLPSYRLGSVYQYLFDEPMSGPADGTHDALSDTMAVRRVYLELIRREAILAILPETIIPPDPQIATLLQPPMAPVFEA